MLSASPLCTPGPYSCAAFAQSYWNDLWNPHSTLDSRLKVLALILGLVACVLWLLSFVNPRQPQQGTEGWRRWLLPAAPLVGLALALLLAIRLRVSCCWIVLLAPLPAAAFVYFVPQIAEFCKEARAKHFSAGLVCGLLFALLVLPVDMRWAAALSALPALLVMLQYVFLWLHRPREAPAPSSPTAGTAAPEQKLVDDGVAHANQIIESHYGQRTLFVRYGLPAIFLLIEGIVVAFVLLHPERFFLERNGELLRGARFGAAGAYCWVLVELGQRSFRRDVTPGVAMWALVTLALGPMLAAIMAFIWKFTPDKDSQWQSALVLFYAGYAPRNLLRVVETAALQMLRAGSSATIELRSTPLTKIRGIDLEIQQRLLEEGIPNVEALAAAEPIRLVRNTSFDLRQILWWMDAALMMVFVPRGWEILEENGITGAIDIADYHNPKRDQTSPGSAEGAAGTPTSPVLAALAQRMGIEPQVLDDIVQRIYWDRQVRYLWTLYNRFTDDGHSHRASPTRNSSV